MEESVARTHLHELECRAIIGGQEVLLNTDYDPPSPEKTQWVRDLEARVRARPDLPACSWPYLRPTKSIKNPLQSVAGFRPLTLRFKFVHLYVPSPLGEKDRVRGQK